MQNHAAGELFRLIREEISQRGLDDRNEAAYLELRKEYNSLVKATERERERERERESLLLFLLICHSFNNQMRFNMTGEFNMPFGKQRSCFNHEMESNLAEFRRALDEMEFSNGDFDGCPFLNGLGPEDYVYCDPPYLITEATYNTSGAGWKEKDDRRLFSLLDRLDAAGIGFGLSNVFECKMNSNGPLKKWAKAYRVHILNADYGNCSYHRKEAGRTVEVFVTNREGTQLELF